MQDRLAAQAPCRKSALFFVCRKGTVIPVPSHSIQSRGHMSTDNANATIRIDLTPEQTEKIKAETGKTATSIEISVQELEARIAPVWSRLALNHNESLLVEQLASPDVVAASGLRGASPVNAPRCPVRSRAPRSRSAAACRSLSGRSRRSRGPRRCSRDRIRVGARPRRARTCDPAASRPARS